MQKSITALYQQTESLRRVINQHAKLCDKRYGEHIGHYLRKAEDNLKYAIIDITDTWNLIGNMEKNKNVKVPIKKKLKK